MINAWATGRQQRAREISSDAELHAYYIATFYLKTMLFQNGTNGHEEFGNSFLFFGISQMLVAPAKEKRKKKKAPTNTSLSLEPSKTPCFYLHTLTLNYMLWRMTGRNNQLPIPHLHPTYVQTHALAHPLFCFSFSLVQGFNAFSQHKNRILMQKLNTKLKLNTKKNIQCKPMSHILHKHLKKYLTLFYNKDKNCNKLNQECPT